MSAFGTRLLARLAEQVPDLIETLCAAGSAASIRYEDRYLRTPCAAAQVRSLMKALADAGCLAVNTKLIVLTEPPSVHERERTPHGVGDAWTQVDTQRRAIELAVSDLGVPSVQVISRNRAEGPSHRRRLVLEWEGGSRVEVWFDRGLGFAAVQDRGLEFAFSEEVAKQAEALKAADWELVPVETHEAYGVVLLA